MAKKPQEPQEPSARAAKGKDGAEKPPGRLKQIRMVAKVVHQQSPKSIPIAVGVSVALVALAVLGAVLTGAWLYWLLLGLPIAFLVGFIVFTRSAQKVQYKMLDGQLGAGMAILENMRGDWTVDAGVNANRSMDIVHRAVGRPGIVLVGEGDPQRLRGLIAAEKKRTARVAPSTPIYDVQVGNGEGQVPVSELQKRMFKLPRNLDKPEVAELRYRLKALAPAIQMPKGPIPKGVKMPKGPKTQR
ncbi:DUF4191 domain-containing protein [Marinactinospora thermotolerans]|uniref:DUF4191 domain-containing protein n=1 Tax=Marinactinospora thermotolerans DSM 45154 TaxID=1122192 RepID=A0A1T4MBQ3_9ACTN|nr:DUF4191 domain-containing protein [Marinactinospora thermotolerans]SJZ64423.1 protein of unknown function [Marinactinospora thermotolerans DSM 45154]